MILLRNFSELDDTVLGELSFNNGWIKKEPLYFWNTNNKIKIRFSAYKDEEPTKEQQKSYKYFKSNLNTISNKSFKKLIDYCKKTSITTSETDLERSLKIQEILFFKDGSYAIICNINNQLEDDIIVLVENNNIKVGDDQIIGNKI